MQGVDQNSVIKTVDACRVERLLDDLGWAALLIITGVFWLIPKGRMPSGSWLLAVGSIILLFTVARFINRSRVSGFALSAGIIAVIAGLGAVLNLNLPLIPIALIVIGCCMFLMQRMERRSSSPYVEEQPCCK